VCYVVGMAILLCLFSSSSSLASCRRRKFGALWASGSKNLRALQRGDVPMPAAGRGRRDRCCGTSSRNPYALANLPHNISPSFFECWAARWSAQPAEAHLRPFGRTKRDGGHARGIAADCRHVRRCRRIRRIGAVKGNGRKWRAAHLSWRARAAISGPAGKTSEIQNAGVAAKMRMLVFRCLRSASRLR